ncbi:MAG: hypothetical protein GXO80_10340 [Chlorobi bacterium]|nr:hypothetical protein [Chlorobiota bacterium]
MKISNKILDIALSIGFNIDNNIISLPCAVDLENGQTKNNAVLIFLDKLHNQDKYNFCNIEDVISIRKSEYSLPYKIRKASINTDEYRYDKPFFIKRKNYQIIGFNAFSPVNFTYSDNIKGDDIIGTVDFETARKEGFNFIKNHCEKQFYVICGKNEQLLKKVVNL